MRKKARALVLAFVVAASALALTSCANTITKASQCAYVIAHNYFDTAHIKHIALPGERFNTANASHYFVPCNARNYAVTNPSANTGDLKTPIGAKTAPEGSTPGTPVDVQLTAYFTLNENRNVLAKFLPFCQKYNCFSSGSDLTNAATHYSSAGWNGLLTENFQFALKRSVQHALLQFPPDIWNDTSKWPEVADAVSKDLDTQLRQQTGATVDFFCASGATENTCPPIRVTVEQIDPTDSQIRDIYNQEVSQAQEQQLAQSQQKTNVAQLNAAKAKYGDQAPAILGELDTIAACKNAGAQCVISVGGSVPSVTVPAK